MEEVLSVVEQLPGAIKSNTGTHIYTCGLLTPTPAQEHFRCGPGCCFRQEQSQEHTAGC